MPGTRVVTYARRDFGCRDKPLTGYAYGTLAEDLHTLLEQLELTDVTLVGFFMGGGKRRPLPHQVRTRSHPLRRFRLGSAPVHAPQGR